MPCYKPPLVQASVISRRAAGHTKTQIAQALKMSRNTITKILTESEIDQRVQESRSLVLESAPEVTRGIIKEAVKSADFGLRLLRSFGVMPAESNSESGLNFQVNIGEGSSFTPVNKEKVIEATNATVVTANKSSADSHTE